MIILCKMCSYFLSWIHIFQNSLSAVRVLAQSLHDLSTEVKSNREKIGHKFLALLEVSLWGNMCDLSISAGSAQTFADEPLEQVGFKSKRITFFNVLIAVDWN
jgi:hypothetical protein